MITKPRHKNNRRDCHPIKKEEYPFEGWLLKKERGGKGQREGWLMHAGMSIRILDKRCLHGIMDE